MKLLAFAASLRKESVNRRLLGKAVEIARNHGAAVDVAEFREFEMPLYDFDVQEESGPPAGAQELARRIGAADGMIVASPEYNYSMPGPLKNAIDWLSRMEPCALNGACALLISASPSLAGGHRGLWQLRIPFECCGTWIYPKMFSLAQAPLAYDEEGNIRDPALAKMLETMIIDFMSAALALGSRPGRAA